MSTRQNETDDTLELVRSMRDTIRDFTQLAEDQNASIKLSFSGGFLESVPGDAVFPDPEMSGSAPGQPDSRDC
jgi:hypothetical protein